MVHVLVRILLLELGPLLIHGNSSTASQTINVQDITAPVIAAPAIQLSIVLLLQYLL
jgi:hypothetical protein